MNEQNNVDITKYVKKNNMILLNIILFLTTFFTTTLAGVAWSNKDPYQLENFSFGITYSILIMTVITFHEFGHFFAAKLHKISVTYPFYIPFPFLFLNPFGTMGAVIKMKSPVTSRKALFDIGISGPLAGWVVSLAILIWGYTHLPKIDFLYEIHPEYRTTGIPDTGLTFGYNIIIYLLEKITYAFSSKSFIPPMNEIYHYPFLCVGWFGLLITSLNMMPVGQLDGGHISYSMFGKKHKIIAYIVFGLLIFFGLVGILQVYFPEINIGSTNWLLWAILILTLIKIEHPPIIENFNEELGKLRIALGWFSFVIFITSFCPIPISGI